MKRKSKKKDDNDTMILLLGAGVAAYFLFLKKKPTNAPITSIVPVSNGSAATTNNSSNLLTAGSSLFTSITNLFSGGSSTPRTDQLTPVEDTNLDFNDPSTAYTPVFDSTLAYQQLPDNSSIYANSGGGGSVSDTYYPGGKNFDSIDDEGFYTDNPETA